MVYLTAIKICGLSREEDIDIVNQLLPEYIGFIFTKSRREIREEVAKQLKKRLHPSIKTVGVFVNEDMERIVRICQAQVCDLVQLHGNEDHNYIHQLRNQIPQKIIKAIRVKDKRDIQNSLDMDCDYLLYDSHSHYANGGSGTSFDWSLVEGVRKPFFLAGGIHKDNVLEAIRRCNPYGIDVSSGVETDGYKNPEKIREFIGKIRSVIK
jgi:phosphoribosylanthranilate isomerase